MILSVIGLLVYMIYYPATHYTAQLTPISMTFDIDRWIPLWPPAILIYACIYLIALYPVVLIKDPLLFRRFFIGYCSTTLLATLIFILVPVHMEIRPKSIDVVDFYSWGTQLCYLLDPPTCCFPSLHVAMSFFSALSCLQVSKKVGYALLLLAVGISGSTLLVKQHFVADVLLGSVLAWGVIRWCFPSDLFNHPRLSVPHERSYPLRLMIWPSLLFTLVISSLYLYYCIHPTLGS
jgi:membrane-associated phospholipid phosphatase